jgi:polyisoprenoid-binding protein YceI
MDVKVEVTRVIDGREIPPPGMWIIDPSHSEVEFTVRHMMISKVRCRFRQFDGTIVIAERPEESRVEVFIEAASIDTRDATRDEHLRSADFLDVEHYPEIKFTSTSLRPGDAGHWNMTSDLTVREVTRPALLDVEFSGATVDPWGNLRSGFEASTRIDRDEFDITWNQALATGGFLVGKEILVQIVVQAIRQNDS